MGKGRKERIGLLGRPARAALDGYLATAGRSCSAAAPAGARDRRPPAEVFLNQRGGAARRPRAALPARPAPGAGGPAGRRLAAHPAPLLRDPPPRRRGGPAGRPGAARPREPGDDPGLHPRLAGRASERRTSPPTRGLDTHRPTVVTDRPLARPGRADRHRRVPRLAPPRLGPPGRHRRPTFGPTAQLDAFFAAFRIPDLIFQLVAAGALGVGAHPGDRRACSPPTRRARAWRVASTVANVMLAIAARPRPGRARRRAGARPVDHARASTDGPAGPDRRAHPDHAREPDPARPRLAGDEPAQREGPVRRVGRGADRLQPGDHRRRALPVPVDGHHRPRGRGRRRLGLPPRRPAPAAPRDRLPLDPPGRPRRPVGPPGAPAHGPAGARPRREPAHVPRGDVARVEPRRPAPSAPSRSPSRSSRSRSG